MTRTILNRITPDDLTKVHSDEIIVQFTVKNLAERCSDQGDADHSLLMDEAIRDRKMISCNLDRSLIVVSTGYWSGESHEW